MVNMKAQMNIVVIMITLAIFIGLIIFLLTLSKSITTSKFSNLYVTNLLISTMRADTGYYNDPNCKTVSDLIKCAFFTPTWKCGDNGPECKEYANLTLDTLMKRYHLSKKNFRYLLIVDPLSGAVKEPTGETSRLTFGDESLLKSRTRKLPATYYIEVPSGYMIYHLRVRLIISD